MTYRDQQIEGDALRRHITKQDAVIRHLLLQLSAQVGQDVQLPVDLIKEIEDLRKWKL